MFANSDNGGGTDWSQRSVPEMWSMLAPHDGTTHKTLLVTWKKSADLLIDHLSRVKRYRDNLAEAWPPNKSTAAAKYLDRLDDLIQHLTNTHEATIENHRALGAATSSLVSARQKLESIHQEYLANQQQLATYDAKVQQNAQPLSKYRGIILPPNTATPARQLELERQAQSIMSTLSTELIQAQLNITTPPLYEIAKNFDDSRPFGQPGPNTTSKPSNKATLPAIDFSRHKLQSAQPGGDNTGESGSRSPVSNSLPPPSGHAPSASRPGESEPAVPASEVIVPEKIPPMGATRAPAAGSTAGIPGRYIESNSNSEIVRPKIGLPPEDTHSPTRGFQPLPAGGVIGSPIIPGSARPASNSNRAQRINPAGGILGQPGIASPSTPTRRSSRSRDESASGRWDPENPWETDKGVAPILLPAEKAVIDPGPVIGLKND
ncbi:Polycystic kidney disease protein 1-like 3 [Actinoplanes sp. SE50]|uniref:hypothetical protein n=1 Tax=unclassified Actinoplanes TaxID=2626549 RepID=UPI00023EDD72|nr:MULTISPECIES: hypothetical protein [unclassified Actinoplanes]AEV88604.1 Polycystic kidney disease protein 1-like 3 [Actinoplanes sp. SE50/110]ATO87008.1 Polycystic kidney disease protein 1-like 3 [Actinoplanes sp. SE50]SLM04426.1 hypothetical protein ACSP50_7731 [Actinoplanes sp. SE50/110]